MNKKTIVDANIVVWLAAIVDHVKNGWEVNWEVEPGFFGYLYEAEVVKEEKNVEEDSSNSDVSTPEVASTDVTPKRGPKPKAK